MSARCVVRSVTGFSNSARASGTAKPATSYMVLDRAYSHRVVGEFRPGRANQHASPRWRRAAAETLAAELNARPDLQLWQHGVHSPP